MGTWFEYVLEYSKHQKDDNLLFLKYEDLHKVLKYHKYDFYFIGYMSWKSTFQGKIPRYYNVEQNWCKSPKEILRMYLQVFHLHKIASTVHYAQNAKNSDINNLCFTRITFIIVKNCEYFLLRKISH